MTILSHIKTFIPVLSPNPLDNQDFFFQPLAQSNFILFLYLVDHIIGNILVYNEAQCTIRLSCKQKLGLVTKVFYKNCFQAGLDLYATKMLLKGAPLYKSHQKIKICTINPLLDTKLPNNVRVYGN